MMEEGVEEVEGRLLYECDMTDEKDRGCGFLGYERLVYSVARRFVLFA